MVVVSFTARTQVHQRGITHGDLTGRNILLLADGVARLADFGLSTALPEVWGSAYFSDSPRGTLRWAAPELFSPDENGDLVSPNPKCDVYSFGSIMLQVLSEKVPYYYLQSNVHVLGMVVRGIKPQQPSDPCIERQHWEIIEQCWMKHDAGTVGRPSMSVIAGLVKTELWRALHPSHT
ncbi:hypothetical protein HYDPIDRAFT_108967 [Hydnomerulius pinastri MD-312]|nr:hypothetical protein HYDPIDRAFT_108967 [Hydnomerulius pinastri MD-312]